MKVFIFWASWLYFPAAVWLLSDIIRKTGLRRWTACGMLCALSTLAYARFVEPRILVTHREDIHLTGASEQSATIRIALFGDPHIGIFRNAMSLSRIVERINAEHVDAVFLAGDLTYYPTSGQIDRELAVLAELDAPLFVVLGNHDVGRPGPDLSSPVMAALDRVNAITPHNRALEVTIGGQDLIVAGASDLWQRRQDFTFRAGLPEDTPIILLTHNPDTALNVPYDFAYDLMLAGHTHGGQIRLPWLYRKAIPTDWPFDKELHVFPTPAGDRLVYVTSGTGMVGLPMRFLMPPRIDILTVHLPE